MTMLMSRAGLISLVLLLGACSTGVKLDPNAPIENRSTGGTAAGAAVSRPALPAPAAQSNVASVSLAAAPKFSKDLGRTIYFDYDSDQVRDEFKSLLDEHGQVLSADRKRRLSIEGHTDERGGREYNLALGQRRAEAVAKVLMLLGVNEAQIEAVSFGKERPAVNGSDEAAWAKNRRAELQPR